MECNDNYSTISGSFWQFYWDEPNANLADSKSVKSKIKATWSNPRDGNTSNVNVAVRWKYENNFWRTV